MFWTNHYYTMQHLKKSQLCVEQQSWNKQWGCEKHVCELRCKCSICLFKTYVSSRHFNDWLHLWQQHVHCHHQPDVEVYKYLLGRHLSSVSTAWALDRHRQFRQFFKTRHLKYSWRLCADWHFTQGGMRSLVKTIANIYCKWELEFQKEAKFRFSMPIFHCQPCL